MVARSLEHAGLAEDDEVREVGLGIWTKDAEEREGVQFVGKRRILVGADQPEHELVPGRRRDP